MEIYTATITGFYTQFSSDDSVVPFVQITPITDHNGFCVNQIPIVLMSDKSDFMLAIGDVLNISVTKMKFLVKVATPSFSERVNVNLTHCPVCHRRLVRINGMPFCTNVNCRAHLREHIYTMLSAIGFRFDNTTNRIIESILNKMYIDTPLDLFKITVNDLNSIDISESDAQYFIQCLHSIRGHVTLEQYFKAINIVGMSQEYTARLCNVMRGNCIDLDSIEKLPTISMPSALPFSAADDLEYFSDYWLHNKDFMIQLGKILYS